MKTEVDAVVVGSGPNGLAAAVTLARAGLSVTLVEGAPAIGGSARTAELTLPGFLHDVGSAVHPMAVASPFFRAFHLTERVKFVVPQISYAHPLDGANAAVAWRDLHRTIDGLGSDGPTWRALLMPLIDRIDSIADIAGNSLLRLPHRTSDLARLGLRVLDQGTAGWNRRFDQAAAPALLTGVLAHSIQPLPSLAAAAVGLVLAAHGHAGGWPVPVGGSQAITNALASDLVAHGGSIVTDTVINSLAELPRSKIVMLDTSPRAFASLAGSRLPDRYARSLRRYRYGNGVAKVDYALSAPVPWTDPLLAEAATIHLGGSRAQIVAAERDVHLGRMPERPYVVVAQPTAHDPSRAPAGKHVLWAYTHVPHGSAVDRREAITTEIERIAPGFRDTILAFSSQSATDIEGTNPNHIGGDISTGAVDLGQLIRRPTSFDPWRTPLPGVYLCSSSTAPGPGVHGLSGWRAARSALRHEFGIALPPDLYP